MKRNQLINPVLIIITCLFLFSCKKKEDKKDDPAPDQPNNPPVLVSYDPTKVIGVWQGISEKDYDLNADGSISNTLNEIFNGVSDTTAGDDSGAMEFAGSNIINGYTAGFYEAWGKDTIIKNLNYATYEFVNSNSAIKFTLAISDYHTLNILELTDTKMVLQQKEGPYNGIYYIEEYTYTKINGHAFTDFIFDSNN